MNCHEETGTRHGIGVPLFGVNYAHSIQALISSL